MSARLQNDGGVASECGRREGAPSAWDRVTDLVEDRIELLLAARRSVRCAGWVVHTHPGLVAPSPMMKGESFTGLQVVFLE